ncbi:MAG: hypothetical protein WCT49_05190 [Candidatus Paceibacterota bacterium]|nr:hypothetical protein [Candidatus Paceibacterota bacterium]
MALQKELLLFFGIALFLSGILNFSNGKYCDGNVADYYACTNTAVYYYYGPLSIGACILGAFFVTVWKMKRER